MVPRLELFAFHYRDPRTGKWIRARYRAEHREIAARYAEWVIIGPAEIRGMNPDARYFAPDFNAMMNAEMRRFRERPPELQPTLDVAEAFLVRTFLRRYELRLEVVSSLARCSMRLPCFSPAASESTSRYR